MIGAALDPDRYPDRTAFVPADADDVELMLSTNLAEGHPVALVYPDGREVIATPEAGRIAWVIVALGRAVADLVRRRWARRDEALVPSVEVPGNSRVEIRGERAAT